MSKHLPSQPTTDFSTDALLKQQQQQQDKGSTIQWIGHHNHHFHQQTSPMPATALLRQLYANRESVIRATTRPAPSGVFYTGEGIHFEMVRAELEAFYFSKVRTQREGKEFILLILR